MGIEKRVKQIGDHSYELVTFGAKRSVWVLMTLIRFIGPGLSEALKEDDSFTSESIAKAVQKFAQTAKPEDLDQLQDDFAAQTTLIMTTQTTKGAGQVRVALSKVYDTHFAGDLQSLFAWFGWAVVENYRSFFEGTKGEILEKLKEMQTPPESPSQTG